MKYLIAFIFALSVFAVPSSLQAQLQLSSSISREITGSTYNTDNDFDLYFRNPIPVTKYFVEYVLEDGSVEDDGPYDTRNRAAEVLFFNFEHGLTPPGTISTDIVERGVLPPFTYFGRFGTCWEAIHYSVLLEQVGMETSIVCIDVRPKIRSVYNSTKLLRAK